MSFRPEPVPYTDDISYLREYIGRQFNILVGSFEVVDLVQLDELHIPPERAVMGMLRFADGTDWNPGAGRGLYFYTGTAWEKLIITTASGLNAEILGELTITNQGDGAELLTLNTERPWIFKQGSTGTTTTLDLQSTTANKNFRILNSVGDVLFSAGDINTAVTVGRDLILGTGQIAFPSTQNASSGANTLDDYEEGTFTPTLSFGGGSTGITYAEQVGRYIKIGRLVFVSGRVRLTSKGTSTGNAEIEGFPFFGISSTFPGAVGHHGGMTGLTSPVSFLVSTSTVTLRQMSATTTTPINDTHFTANGDLIFGVTMLTTN